MTKASRPEDFPIFGSLGVEAASRMFTIRIIISPSAIMEAIERVEKRRVYFHVFYNGCKMGELNETALLCYWILKLHPFSFPGMDSDVINAKIALCLFTDTVVGYVQDNYGKSASVSPQFLKDVYYSFRFRELSKEAIMLYSAAWAWHKPHLPFITYPHFF